MVITRAGITKTISSPSATATTRCRCATVHDNRPICSGTARIGGFDALPASSVVLGADGSEIGRQANRFVASGALVPDGVIIDVMLAGLRRLPRGTGFILDGFPRTAAQAEALDAALAQEKQPLQAAIDCRATDEQIVERIVARRVGSNWGRTYNVRFFPPRTAGRCDQCGGPLIQRVDDREDVVRARLEAYRRQTAPLVSYYAGRGLLRDVDASRDAAAVEDEVAGIIEAAPGS